MSAPLLVYTYINSGFLMVGLKQIEYDTVFSLFIML